MTHFDNLLEHSSVIKHLSENFKPVPIHVRIEVTECCNMRCRFCVWHDAEINKSISSVSTYSGSASLPFERLLALLEELKELGTKAISFTGAGDPLVYPYIEKILRVVYQHGIQFALTSNFAMPLSDSLMEIICKAKWIRISMNAASSETYGKIHSPVETDRELVFNRLKDNIRRLVSARRISGSNVQINSSFVVSEQNCYEVLKAAENARQLGFDSISFRPDDPSIHGSKPFQYSADIQKQFVDLDSLKNDSFAIMVMHSENCRIYKEISGLSCRYANHTAYIAATGEVYPCCYTRYDKRFIVGDISTMSFCDFWWSSFHQKKLDNILIENCPECPYDDTNVRLYNFAPKSSHIKSSEESFI